MNFPLNFNHSIKWSRSHSSRYSAVCCIVLYMYNRVSSPQFHFMIYRTFIISIVDCWFFGPLRSAACLFCSFYNLFSSSSSCSRGDLDCIVWAKQWQDTLCKHTKEFKSTQSQIEKQNSFCAIRAQVCIAYVSVCVSFMIILSFVLRWECVWECQNGKKSSWIK